MGGPSPPNIIDRLGTLMGYLVGGQITSAHDRGSMTLLSSFSFGESDPTSPMLTNGHRYNPCSTQNKPTPHEPLVAHMATSSMPLVI